MTLLAITVGVTAAAVGGTYLAFSAMVMPALRRLPDADAARAMRAVNRAAERGPFLLVFAVGTLSAAALVVLAAPRLPDPAAALEVSAGALSLASTAITIAANVPLNRRLEAHGAGVWPAYQHRWTRLNTVRAAAALAAVALLAAGARP